MSTRSELPPGRKGLPFLGETLSFLRSPRQFSADRRAQHGDVFRTHLLGNPTVFVTGAEGNKWVFGGEERYLKSRWSTPVRMLLGARSSVMLEGSDHRTRRKLLAPHFTRSAVESTVPMIGALTTAHVARWADQGDLRLVPAMKALAFEVATSFLVGAVEPALRAEMARDFDLFLDGFFVAFPYPLPGTKLGRAQKARGRLMKRIAELVGDRDRHPAERHDVLSTLLAARQEDGTPMDREAIVDEIQLLFFAGHDTTVTSTTNVLLHLALHPEALARARAEQDTLGPGPITRERVLAAPWLTQVIQESMRLVPPVGGLFRVMTEDTEHGGFLIPQGWTVVLAVRNSHGDPRAFSEPERFDPDRFGPERAEHRKTPQAFIPFGGGPRICVGQHFAMLEMQIMLAMFVRDWEWTLPDPSKVTWTALPFPRPKDGGRVRWAPRNRGSAGVGSV